MKRTFNYFLLTFITAFVVSCSEKLPENHTAPITENTGQLIVPSTAVRFDEKSARESPSVELEEAEDFARLLAVSLNDKNLRKFIKDEANQKYDGDFDILVSRVLEKKVSGERFDERIQRSHLNGIDKGKETFNKAAKNPKLNISVPVLIERWNDLSQKLLVAVAIGANEKETAYLKAYDGEGNSYLIDAKKEPDAPVIVVGNNERMGYTIGRAVNSKAKNLRTSGNLEKITFIQCLDLNDIEAWHKGGPEIQFDCVVYNNDFSAAYAAASGKQSHVSRETAKDGWIPEGSHLGLFEWYFDDNHGPDYFLQVGEMDDAGSTHKFTIGVTAGKKDVASGSASYELTYKGLDIKLPSELIHYTSSSPRTISDYRIKYTLQN